MPRACRHHAVTWGARPGDCKECDRNAVLDELRALLPPGSTVYTILRSVSRSGMSRVIDPVIVQDGVPRSIRGDVRDILGYSMSKDYDGLKVGGGGMDMGFALVYELSRALYPDGAPLASPANPAAHDGGYALNHRWL